MPGGGSGPRGFGTRSWSRPPLPRLVARNFSGNVLVRGALPRPLPRASRCPRPVPRLLARARTVGLAVTWRGGRAQDRSQEVALPTSPRRQAGQLAQRLLARAPPSLALHRHPEFLSSPETTVRAWYLAKSPNFHSSVEAWEVEVGSLPLSTSLVGKWG